jgi:hypothetical protein
MVKGALHVALARAPSALTHMQVELSAGYGAGTGRADAGISGPPARLRADCAVIRMD